MIDPENTWIIADSHFGHQSIANLCKRPAAYDRLMVEQWRAAVPASATLLHLGDLFYKGRLDWFKQDVAPRLPGTKLLLKGNHDKQKDSFYEECGFKVVEPFEIMFGANLVTFEHYPCLEVPPEGHLHVHGHIHNNGYGSDEPYRRRQVNVSAEILQYRPVNLSRMLLGALR